MIYFWDDDKNIKIRKDILKKNKNDSRYHFFEPSDSLSTTTPVFVLVQKHRTRLCHTEMLSCLSMILGSARSLFGLMILANLMKNHLQRL